MARKILGDINGDGKVDILDILALVKCIRADDCNSINNRNWDIDRDNIPTLKDVIQLCDIILNNLQNTFGKATILEIKNLANATVKNKNRNKLETLNRIQTKLTPWVKELKKVRKKYNRTNGPEGPRGNR